MAQTIKEKEMSVSMNIRDDENQLQKSLISEESNDLDKQTSDEINQNNFYQSPPKNDKNDKWERTKLSSRKKIKSKNKFPSELLVDYSKNKVEFESKQTKNNDINFQEEFQEFMTRILDLSRETHSNRLEDICQKYQHKNLNIFQNLVLIQ